MRRLNIYFEGDPKLRQGFRQFFESLNSSEVSIKLVGCGANALEDFVTSLRSNLDCVNILLMDCEGTLDRSPLDFVKSQPRWDPSAGSGVTEEQVHLMVQVMETWFLADRHSLGSYYGPGFRDNRLPGNPNVEQVPKDDVLGGLADATRETKKGRYHKTRHAPGLLATVDVTKVRAAAPACARLFEALARLAAPPG